MTYGTLYHTAHIDSNIKYGAMFIIQHMENPLCMELPLNISETLLFLLSKYLYYTSKHSGLHTPDHASIL